jgi:hypothetical protein
MVDRSPAVEIFTEPPQPDVLHDEPVRKAWCNGKYTLFPKPRVNLPVVQVVEPAKRQEPARNATRAAPKVRFLVGQRSRKRGRVTNALEELAKLDIGRWTRAQSSSDLPGVSRNDPHAWLSAYVDSTGLKIAAGEAIRAITRRDVEIPAELDETGKVLVPAYVEHESVEKIHGLLYVPFAMSTGHVRHLAVLPALLADLVKARLFRAVSASLMGSLRGRARQWADDHGLSDMDLVHVMPGTLTLALLPMPDETAALGALRGSAGRWSADVLGAFAKGVLKEPSEGRGWKDALRWFSSKSGRVLAPGVDTLTLPA